MNQSVLYCDLSWDDQLLETFSELVLDLHRGREGFVVLVLCGQLKYFLVRKTEIFSIE